MYFITGAQVTYLEMTVGGFGWVTNLTTVDPYLVLPIMLTLVNLTIFEVSYITNFYYAMI